MTNKIFNLGLCVQFASKFLTVNPAISIVSTRQLKATSMMAEPLLFVSLIGELYSDSQIFLFLSALIFYLFRRTEPDESDEINVDLLPQN